MSRAVSVLFFLPPDPLGTQGYQDAASSTRPDNDPEKPPVKEPGGVYTVIFAIVGLLAGGVFGFFLAWGLVGTGILFIAVAGGAFLGGLIGAAIGGAIGRRMCKGRGD